MWGILTLLVGLAYGYLTPGRQDKTRLLVLGTGLGLVLALVLGVLASFAGLQPLGVALGAGAVGIFLTVLVLTVLFVLGVLVGDWLEHRKPSRSAG
jgi:uncharacterized membrane protein